MLEIHRRQSGIDGEYLGFAKKARGRKAREEDGYLYSR
jgi:hypothetical protein